MLHRILTNLIIVLALSGAVFAYMDETAATKDADRAATPKPLPFEPDEQLIYEGEFSKLLLRGINIAEFKFTVERAPAATTTTGGKDAPPAAPANLIFKGDVVAKGWFRKLFGIDFHYNSESIVDPNTLRILSNTTRDEQGKRLRTTEATFDRVQNLLTWSQRNPHDPQSAPRVVSIIFRPLEPP